MTQEQEKLNILIAELLQAKWNVKWLLDNPDWMAWMHGIEYRAKEVERLRKEIKELL